MRPTFRMRSVQSPVIPVVGELVRENPGTVSLGQGVVHYGPPPEAAEHVGRFLGDPENHRYKPVQGIPELLDAIQAKLRDENGIVVDDSNAVVVTAGANMGFVNAVLAVTDPGDEIILQVPYYFNHEMAIAIADCRAVCVPTDENYQLQPEEIRKAITDRTRAVVTISPNNPTGAVYAASDLREVNAICRDKGVYHIHDEAYEYFTYDGAEHFSPGKIEDSSRHTISLFSFSKAYGFASWRVGYMVIPEHLLTSVKKIQDTILICPPVVSQWAAVGALKAGAESCRERLPEIADVRRIVLSELAAIEDIATVSPASGAFYVLLRVKADLDAMELAERLIREYRVAAIPGTPFGINDSCCLRVAYGALEKEAATEGIGRLVTGLRSIIGGRNS